MSSACNRISMNLDAIAGGSEIDEETWLVEPPKTDSSTQSSGHIIEWLQGAAANVDYKTRTALSRTLASQAARRKKKKAEKLLQKLQLEKLQLSEIRETLADEENLIKQRCRRAPLRDLTVPEADAGSPKTEHRLRNSVDLENADIESGHHLSTMAASAVITPKSDSESDDEFFDAASDLALASLSEHGTAEPRPTEKIKPISPRLNSLAECVEPPASNAGCQKKSINALSSPRSLEMANGASPNVTPRANTARIAPTIMNKSLSHSPRDEKSVRNSAPLVSKAHSLTNPDLRDIEQIAEMQEIALREEVMQRQRKTSTQSDSSNTPLSRPQTGPSSAHSTKSNPAMASSRSVDFFVEAQGAPSAPHPTTHVSRLPTPLRRPGGTMRSMIPTPTSRISVPKVAVRGLAGGSTPSLAPFDTRRPADETQSECGRNEWADECF
uniref:Uncharacterized protein n=1 Tax=Parascaris univalens TaxID=6257 RepID=A0A915BAI1_PARUN